MANQKIEVVRDIIERYIYRLLGDYDRIDKYPGFDSIRPTKDPDYGKGIDVCITCGGYVPEGYMVCVNCRSQTGYYA